MKLGSLAIMLLAGVWQMPVSAGGVATPAPTVAAAGPAEGILQVVMALVLVLLLIVGMGWLMRRVTAFSYGSGGAIRVLGGVPVGQRERAVLVQVGEQQLLLGVAPGRVQTLYVLPQPVSMGGVSTADSESFADRLSAVLKRGGRT